MEPKNGKARTISLSANLVAILRSHRAAQAKEKLFFGTAYRDQGLVFAEPTGDCVKPWNFGAAFKDLVRRASRECSRRRRVSAARRVAIIDANSVSRRGQSYSRAADHVDHASVPRVQDSGQCSQGWRRARFSLESCEGLRAARRPAVVLSDQVAGAPVAATR
jgi:hypothetical protein